MNTNPQIGNFRIQPGQPRRVYFDSTKPITQGIDGINGFIIQGQTIESVEIQTGFTTNHYFTLSRDQIAWEQILIRYEGSLDSNFNSVNNQSTITDDAGNPLFDFRLIYIKNNLEIVETTINRYVALTGSDSNDGTTEAKAWRTVNYGVAHISQGTTLWVKAGNYGGESFVIPGGTLTEPIKVKGYKNTIGDAVNLNRFRGMVLKDTANELPYFENGSNSYGVSTGKHNYITVENIQVSNYADVCFNVLDSSYIILRNCYMDESQHGVWSNQSDTSIGMRVIDCYSANMSKSGINVWGRGGLIDNCLSVTSRASSQDYYLGIRGSKLTDHSHSNVIINSKIHRFEDDVHTGHGLSIAVGWGQDDDGNLTTYRSSKYNLLQSSEVINCNNSGVEFRYSGSSHNVARDILMRGEDHLSNDRFKGFTINEDSHHNVGESCTIYNTSEGVRFIDTGNDLGSSQSGGFDNRFLNCSWLNVRVGIGCTSSQINKRNSFINCTFKNINRMFVRSQSWAPSVFYPPANWLDDTNEFLNCIFDTISIGDYNGSVEVLFNNSNFYSVYSGDWSYNASGKAGSNNISVNPDYEVGSLVPQNEALNAGVYNELVPYDKNNDQRYGPIVTIGCQTITGEVPIPPSDKEIKLSWIPSDTPGVVETVLYKNGIELIRVPIGDTPEYIDGDGIELNTAYTYVAQAVDAQGIESTTKTVGVNDIIVTTPE